MGLFKTAARVAVASSVHGRVQRRQQSKWAAQDAAAAPAAGDMGAMLEQLTKLGELKAAGVLTDAEFEAQKARILAG